MKHLLFYIFTLFNLSGYAQKTLDSLLKTHNTRSIPYISVEELRWLQVNDSVTILDTREQKEFEVSHIASAKFIGYSKFSSEAVTETIKDKNTNIVVYCSLGIRSEDIGEKLKKAGYTNVRNLYGGIFEWKNKGYAVYNSEEKKTDSIHTFSYAWSKWLKKGKKAYPKTNTNE